MTAARTTLHTIRDLWQTLDTIPAPGRRDIPREQTPEQRDAARQRWEDELTDKLAGAIGRGASPAPCNLSQLQARIAIGRELCELADRVASRTQPKRSNSGRPENLDPSRWDYTHTHGADWAITWLLGALDNDLPSLVQDDVDRTLADIARRLEIALDNQTTRNAGHCTCGQRLTVADWDTVITCPNCRTAHGRRDWLRLRDRTSA